MTNPLSWMPTLDVVNGTVEDPATGNRIPFTPNDCLMIFGYGALKFTYYNAANSTWPLP